MSFSVTQFLFFFSFFLILLFLFIFIYFIFFGGGSFFVIPVLLLLFCHRYCFLFYLNIIIFFALFIFICFLFYLSLVIFIFRLISPCLVSFCHLRVRSGLHFLLTEVVLCWDFHKIGFSAKLSNMYDGEFDEHELDSNDLTDNDYSDEGICPGVFIIRIFLSGYKVCSRVLV